MDMEDLTKQQMVLLTLLVSFVASTATSITIVSIITDTTPVISQTFNRIVEKTIERVVTGTTTPSVIKIPTPAPSVPTESDQIVIAVQTNLSFMASIATPKTEKSEGEKRGMGFVAGESGLIVTDKNVSSDWNEFTVTFLNGKSYTAKKVFVDEKTGIALLELYDGDKKIVLRGASLASSDAKLGQTILSLGGKGMSTVSQGIISEIVRSSDKERPITHLMSSFSYSLSDRGGPVFGIDGKVVGINLVAGEGKGFTLGINHVLEAVSEFKKPKTDKLSVGQTTDQPLDPPAESVAEPEKSSI